MKGWKPFSATPPDGKLALNIRASLDGLMVGLVLSIPISAAVWLFTGN